MEFKHIPILKNEIIELLNINPNGTYVDCTVGGAGHSSAICEKLSDKGRIICFDKDIEALNVSKQRLSNFACKKVFIHSDFHNYEKILGGEIAGFDNVHGVDGVLIDLGVSSYQLDNKDRGFSYMLNGKLDMRMNREDKISAYDVVNFYSEQKLTEILFEFGEEPFTKNIVRNIIKQREQKPIETTSELVSVINSSVPVKNQIDNASVKRVFQAIRIEGDNEINGM